MDEDPYVYQGDDDTKGGGDDDKQDDSKTSENISKVEAQSNIVRSGGCSFSAHGSTTVTNTAYWILPLLFLVLIIRFKRQHS